MATASSATPSPENLLPNVLLRETDGEPLESPWHRAAINLLIEQTMVRFEGRSDYYVGGNMFIYYSAKQALTWEYRGPDYFFVKDVDGTRERRYWVVWDEDGRYPDMILELLSPRTARADRTTKKALYEQTFHTHEYFCYDPATRRLEGWRLNGQQRYQDIAPQERGWLWSEQLGLWLGLWEGEYLGIKTTWPRFYDAQGQLVLLKSEREAHRAEQERQRAEQERRRAETAEAELAKVKALLAEKGLAPPSSSASQQ